MATISSPGVGSGLDVNSIVTQLVAVERQPIVQLQTQATSLQTKLSAFGKLQSDLSTLRDAASALTSPSTWNQTSGSSSDAASVSVTTDASNRPGSYSVQVTQLAQSQSNISKTYSAATDLVGEGTLHIELGSWGTGNSFTAKPGATAIDISVGPPAKSLAEVRDMVNAANAGITATVLSDASGSRLVFRSSTTGAVNGFRITATDADSNNVDTSGLSALAYDPSVGVVTMSQALAAANASALLNGAPVSSTTNTLTNVVDGMTLQLQRVTTAPVQISTAPDPDAIRNKIQAFVTAYNGLNNELVAQTKYDAANKIAGTLQGDSAAVSLRGNLRNTLARQQRRLEHLHSLGRHRLRRATRRNDQARQQQARQCAGQSGRAEEAVLHQRSAGAGQRRLRDTVSQAGRPGPGRRRLARHPQRRPARPASAATRSARPNSKTG